MGLKEEFLSLLERDREFRYAVIGLLGLEDLRSSVKTLANAIAELTEIQRKSEERLGRLEEKVNGLSESIARLANAQMRAEERLGRLEEAHVRLEESMTRLAKVQSGTIGRLGKLEEAMIRLIDAQKRIEERLGRLEESHIKLIDRFKGLSREMGRLSETMGFSLEDIARVVVPGWLYRHEGIVVKDLVRKFFYIEGTEIEVNLYGEGIRNGKRIIILGKVKSRIYRSDVEKFYESAKRIAKAVREHIYPLMFAFYIHPSAEEEARVRGIRLIASYMR